MLVQGRYTDDIFQLILIQVYRIQHKLDRNLSDLLLTLLSSATNKVYGSFIIRLLLLLIRNLRGTMEPPRCNTACCKKK